jgi:hypothetical protein
MQLFGKEKASGLWLLASGCWLLAMTFYSGSLGAQHTHIRTGGPTDYILDRIELKSGQFANDYFHTTLKSYRRMAVANYVDSLKVDQISLSKADYFNLEYLINDNFEWSKQTSSLSKKAFLKTLYTRKAAMYSVQIPDFNLVVNPVLLYQVSSDKNSLGENALINNRGIEIRGNIGKNIGFYTQVSDEILKPYSWVDEYYQRDRSLMYTNFVKGYGTYYGYFLSNAYVTGNLNKYMDLQFGHTRNFIGDGYRTFILGDNQSEYLNLRLNTRIWKMNYTNIWAELRDPPVATSTGRGAQPRHYMATHHLSLNLGKNFNLGLFETVLFNRDSGYINTGFDPNYLNPVIFYKSIENGMNSTDKTIIGINYKYNFLKRFSLYGQIVFAEFVLAELKAGNGWLHNKYAVQTGLKHIDFAGIKNLDVQGEFNLSRPFMYTSYNPNQSFSMLRQFMAHPIGANFFEGIALMRYQPINRLTITGRLIYALYGNDTNGSNWGKDPRLSYNYPSSELYGNFIGQGVETKLLTAELLATYMWKHNLFFDVRVGQRKTTSVLPQFASNSTYFTLGIRLNINDRRYDF